MSKLNALRLQVLGSIAAASAVVVSAPALALTTVQDTAITDAYTAAESSIGIVVGGMLGMALLLCGFYVVYNLLKK